MKTHYNPMAVALHWLMALGLLGTFALGFYMHDLPLSPNMLKLYSWHKWAGIGLLLLIVVRLGWRIVHPAPTMPASMGRLSRLAAHAGHWLLYALMLVIPISGWLMSSAQGFQVVWFGVVPLPDLVSKNAELGALLMQVHKYLNYTLFVAVIGHAGAALGHHFIKKDTVLTRMLPFLAQA
ncbi:cytochrome b [Pusillimonas sp.]|uniref:cytochrome b n=1 Tax=Pusillimonas sp. TaxID=3040095 RepID=UPI0037CC45F7